VHRPVELTPPLVPTRLHFDAVEPRRRLTFDVRRELELVVTDDLLEALGEALDPLGPSLLRAGEWNADRDPLQRKTLFSLSKKPSSFL
jgi:hypothetical protein